MMDAQVLYGKAKGLIPGGTQLLSKRPEMFLPNQWVNYYTRAKGAYVWGLDKKKYLDMSYMGIGSCVLGYADKDVNHAVIDAIKSGSMSTLNCPEEVQLAELLVGLHPWAGMVRYARTGGEAMAVAVRIARAHTKKDKIVFCGYHGWHDWYLAANLAKDKNLDGHLLSGLKPNGVPRGLTGTAIPFNYNDIEELKAIVDKNKDEIAAIVMEPIRNFGPRFNFLENVRDIATQIDVPLIFDEITSGWRTTNGGIHKAFSVNPDIAVFGKAMSNGYPMAAIIGRDKIMASAQDSFISSTYWTERIGTVAALATINKFSKLNVATHLIIIGQQVSWIWQKMANKYNIKIDVTGITPLLHISFDSQAVRTLFTQIMLSKGILSSSGFYASYAHKQDHLKRYEEAVDSTFRELSSAIIHGEVEKKLKGVVAHSGFQRLN